MTMKRCTLFTCTIIAVLAVLFALTPSSAAYAIQPAMTSTNVAPNLLNAVAALEESNLMTAVDAVRESEADVVTIDVKLIGVAIDNISETTIYAVTSTTWATPAFTEPVAFESYANLLTSTAAGDYVLHDAFTANFVAMNTAGTAKWATYYSADGEGISAMRMASAVIAGKYVADIVESSFIASTSPRINTIIGNVSAPVLAVA